MNHGPWVHGSWVGTVLCDLSQFAAHGTRLVVDDSQLATRNSRHMVSADRDMPKMQRSGLIIEASGSSRFRVLRRFEGRFGDSIFGDLGSRGLKFEIRDSRY